MMRSSLTRLAVLPQPETFGLAFTTNPLRLLNPPSRRLSVLRVPVVCARSKPEKNAETALVIVESPAKALTIQKLLPEDRYKVRSCVGHIRELPGSAKRIPAKYKGEPWARLGVDVEDGFRPLYVLISGKQPIITKLKAELKESDELILATDEDREGEAISWHLTEVLKPSIPIKRAVFHEITPEAIEHAFSSCREIDLNLVQAQETRRVLDRLAGYTMSPLLWKKIARGLSAGRVQSVAMSVVVHRELERLRFVRAEYYDCTANFTSNNGNKFVGTLAAVNGVRLVRGSDFEDETGKLSAAAEKKGLRLFDEQGMKQLVSRLQCESAKVSTVEKKRTTRNPPVPLITSTLQQECGNKLGMGAGRCMRVAQKLYENGLITYMRTDNPSLSGQAVKACREAVKELYGADTLRKGASGKRGSKPKAAQAAHEAIRPAGTSFRRPEELTELEADEQAVYSLIYRRTLATQMVPALLDQTAVKITVPCEADVAEFKATGSVVVDPGFLRAYHGDDISNTSSYLPAMKDGDALGASNITVVRHETKPPARYNDASLVKELEELGVGRPSTYASIIEKLIQRGYAYRGSTLGEGKSVSSKSLVPSLTAFAVEKLLRNHFPNFVDAKFTASMEEALDKIASGSQDRTKYLKSYYCGEEGLAASVERREREIDGGAFREIWLPNMPKEMQEKKGESKATKGKKTLDWSTTRVLVGTYGPYVEQDGSVVASLPKATLADELCGENLEKVLHMAQDPQLGVDSESGLPVLLKTSRYGPYVQLGRDEDAVEGTKPKRCGLLPGMDVSEITLEVACKLLSLPRVLGKHHSSGEEVRAAIGPYGPYVVCEGVYVSLRKGAESVLEIELDEAVELLDAAIERKRVRAERSAKKKAEKEAESLTAGSKKRQGKRSVKVVTSAVSSNGKAQSDEDNVVKVGAKRRNS